jgi:hypothetical protein
VQCRINSTNTTGSVVTVCKRTPFFPVVDWGVVEDKPTVSTYSLTVVDTNVSRTIWTLGWRARGLFTVTACFGVY